MIQKKFCAGEVAESAVFFSRKICRPIVASSFNLKNLHPTTNSFESRCHADKFFVGFYLASILIEHSFTGRYYFWLVALKAPEPNANSNLGEGCLINIKSIVEEGDRHRSFNKAALYPS
jgi:hypothetical protein